MQTHPDPTLSASAAAAEGIEAVPGLLTKAQAARFLGIAWRTLDDWRRAGAIACIERPGYVRFLQADLDAFVVSHRKEAR